MHKACEAPGRAAYRVDEVAAMLGVHRRTVLRAIDKGELQSTKALGVRLVLAASVAALLDGPRARGSFNDGREVACWFSLHLVSRSC